MLPNAYLNAKIGFDIAKNEPANFWWKICKTTSLQNFANFAPEVARRRGQRRRRGDVRGRSEEVSGKHAGAEEMSGRTVVGEWLTFLFRPFQVKFSW